MHPLERAQWLRRLAGPVLASFLLQPFALVTPILASVRMDEAGDPGRARLVAPAEGEAIGAAAVRFAYELPTDTKEGWIVVSRRSFDPSGWRELPTDPDLTLVPATGEVVSLDQLGFDASPAGPIYWAVVSRDGGPGRLHASEVRTFTALPRFTNRVAASPYLVATRQGRLEMLAPEGAGNPIAAAAPRIRLSAGYDFAPAEGEPNVPVELSSARLPIDDASGDGLASYLVQFATPPSDEDRARIARAGGAVFAYIPDQAYLVRMRPEARDGFESETGAAWIGDYQPAYKMSPLLSDPSIERTGAFMALLFPDAEPAAAQQALTARGCTIENVSDNGVNKLVRFRASEAALVRAAGLGDVAWIEPVVPKTVLNDNAQWVVQTNVPADRKIWNQGLRGQGQVVMTSDSGIDVTHNMFRDPAVAIPGFGDYTTHRKIIAYKMGGTSSAIAFGDHGGANSYHGSHTGCTMVGWDDPVAGTSIRDGMAKEAKIYFMDLSGASIANSVVPFDDLNDLFLPPYVGNAAGAARLSSNSWGSAVSGAYDLNAMQVDQFVYNHPDFYIAFSNGNSAGAGTVGSPASAKNLAGSGGTQNGLNAGNIYASTSRGPTQDGRRKPLFCTPGQSVASANVGPSSFAILSGTSMSCPTSTGNMALVRQYFTEGWYPTGAATPSNAFSPSAALMKAMAVNAGDNGVTGFTAPDNNVGYGRLKIDNVLYFPGDTQKLLVVDNTDGLGQGQFIEYQVNVIDTAVPLEVSLCWTDYPGNPTALNQLVNNLDLTVSNGATVYKGNYFVGGGGNSVVGGTYDNLNVEENVRVAVPAAGLWTVRVAAPTVPVGPQGFGLVVTGGVGNGAGTLALDRAEYGSASTVEIQVVDTNALPTLSVEVASDTEPTGETVILSGSNGVWTGSLQLGPTEPQAADGVLSVSDGDGLTATYDDQAPLVSLLAQATVSLATPVITNVKATSQGAAGTLVTWNTNRNATATVHYGLTPALELGSVNGQGARLAHQVLLTSLTPGATYYYDVENVALNGSSARDDAGGVHHLFTAKGSGDILLLLGEGFPRLSSYQTALTALNYDTDVWSGPLADNPLLGDRNSGLRSYKAVIWQCGFDTYPPITDTQRDVITNYIDGGGRLGIVGHDIGWGLADPTSPSYSPARAAWLASTLKTTFQADPTTWAAMFGYASDPISGGYVGGIGYEPIRPGGAGDEVDVVASPGGTTAYLWRNSDGTPDDCSFRWESSTPNGNALTALWGGAPSRLVNMYFEWTGMDPPYNAPSGFRNDILDKTIVWLMGRARPTVAVTSPNGGETLITTSANITWNETIGGGFSAASRTIQYSTDGGDSWVTLTTSAGPSPYLWDLTTVPNSTTCLVRVRIVDDGTPAPLAQSDQSNAMFTIARPGGDTVGPLVVAGSIASAPNPIVRPNTAQLTATVSDATTGGSGVIAAEWSSGPAPAGAGSGTPLGGTFGGNTVAVSISVDTTPFATGPANLWVRAQDGAGNWGPASKLEVQVNGEDAVGVDPIPQIAFLSQNVPNPFASGGTVLHFGMPRDGAVELGVYTVQGQLVRRLVTGSLPAGTHVARWDGTNGSGVRVAPGVYYAALRIAGTKLERKMISIP
ncbi:MAG: S8 family serine peptidase [Candidatus Eiseniibacteriota bacterium]